MSSKTKDHPKRPGVKPVKEPPALSDEDIAAELRERDKTFAADARAARPAAEVKRRLLQRYHR